MGNTIRNNRMIDKHARRLVPSKYNHTEDRSFMYEWKSSSQKNKNIVLGNGIVRQKRLLTYPRKVLHVHKNDTVRRKQLLTYPRKSSLQKYKNSLLVHKNDTSKRKRLLTVNRFNRYRSRFHSMFNPNQLMLSHLYSRTRDQVPNKSDGKQNLVPHIPSNQPQKKFSYRMNPMAN